MPDRKYTGFTSSTPGRLLNSALLPSKTSPRASVLSRGSSSEPMMSSRALAYCRSSFARCSGGSASYVMARSFAGISTMAKLYTAALHSHMPLWRRFMEEPLAWAFPLIRVPKLSITTAACTRLVSVSGRFADYHLRHILLTAARSQSALALQRRFRF